MARDAYKYFRIEASEIIDRLTQALIPMRKGTGAPGAVRELLRLAHTLKGAAHVVNESRIATEAHAIESQLSPYSGHDVVPPELAALLLVAVERLSEWFNASTPSREEVGAVPTYAQASEPVQAHPVTFPVTSAPVERARIDTSKQPSTVIHPHAEEGLRTVRVDLDEMDQVVQSVTESMVRLGAVQNAMAALERATALSNALSLHVGSLSTANDSSQRRTRIAGLADNLASTLALARRELAANVDQLSRELTSLEESTSHLRLTPVSGLFIPLERAALAASQQLRKQIHFTSSGGDLRIDAQLLASVREPLLHVVRNAVAHGIESPSERRAKDKPVTGSVAVLVERRGSEVAFVCRDDGRGIDLERIRSTAVQKGFLTAEEAAAAKDDELLSLISRPGFTTETRVNEVSGRGIGLDAVAATMSQLRGSIRISTRHDEGTTVELVAPAALLVTEVVLAEASGQVVALPSGNISETLRVTAADIVNEYGHERLIANGALYPYFSMSRVLGTESEPGAHVAVLLNVAGRRAAIGVDRLRGTDTLVSRPLPSFVIPEQFVAGVALDPQGTPQLILDPQGLIAAAEQHSRPAAVPSARPLPILVIDDSLTTRILEQNILEAAGFQVETAVTAEQGLEKARLREFGLFLVDVEMPGMNGFEFVEFTRADEQLRVVPAILVTSRSAPEDRARGRAAGASDYVVKSEFDQGYLLDRIRQLVRSA